MHSERKCIVHFKPIENVSIMTKAYTRGGQDMAHGQDLGHQLIGYSLLTAGKCPPIDCIWPVVASGILHGAQGSLRSHLHPLTAPASMHSFLAGLLLVQL